jgi:hypothetical protein
VHSDWLSPPLTLTALPPHSVTLVLAELCQTITTDSRHSMCKHRRHQQSVDQAPAPTLQSPRCAPMARISGYAPSTMMGQPAANRLDPAPAEELLIGREAEVTRILSVLGAPGGMSSNYGLG